MGYVRMPVGKSPQGSWENYHIQSELLAGQWDDQYNAVSGCGLARSLPSSTERRVSATTGWHKC